MKQVVRAGALGCLARGSRRAALAKPHPTQTETEAEGSSRSCQKPKTTLNNGYLGSRNDEERSEMRYVV